MAKIRLYTIGFTKKSAEQFFESLKKAGVEMLIDVRLNNQSQLAGFTKGRDLPYFLGRLCSCAYDYRPDWAPTKEILEGYKKKKITWERYELAFNDLLKERAIETQVDEAALDNACLLCSEPVADMCHRRLVAEYLQSHFPAVSIWHL